MDLTEEINIILFYLYQRGTYLIEYYHGTHDACPDDKYPYKQTILKSWELFKKIESMTEKNGICYVENLKHNKFYFLTCDLLASLKLVLKHLVSDTVVGTDDKDTQYFFNRLRTLNDKIRNNIGLLELDHEQIVNEHGHGQIVMEHYDIFTPKFMDMFYPTNIF